jgi:hypothetical protein
LPLLIVLLAAGADGQLSDPYLYNLGAGSVLRVLAPIHIPANSWSEPLARHDSAPQFHCTLRVKEASASERVIPAGRELVVERVERSGFSYRHWIGTSTRVKLRSKSLDDIACSIVLNGREPRVSDFAEALRGRLSVQKTGTVEEIG